MGRAEVLQGVRAMRFEGLLDRHERGELNQEEAAEMLGVSERTFRRWRDRLRDEGPVGLRDRRIGKPSSRRAAVAEIQRMLGLYEDRYEGFTVKHFHEQLVKRHDYKLGYTVTALGASQEEAAPALVGMMLHQSLMGWMAPKRHLCAKLGMQLQQRGPSMTQVTTIGLDLAKRVFQVHGVDAAGAVVLRRQLKRRQMVPFFTKLPSCLIGMEACGTAHHWGRTLRALGHEVRLIPPAYAKAYVRRKKTDPADAEAICEAVSRPARRFVPIKSEADQAMAAVHRVRERLIAQRTQTINMLRGQMAEFGVVAAKGPQHVKELVAELVEPESLPEPLRKVLLGLVQLLAVLREQIAALDKQILAWHRANPCSRRLSGIDGFGPILSSALALRVQEPQRFACGRDLSAWIGPCSCQGQACMGRWLSRPLLYDPSAVGIVWRRMIG